MFLLDKAETGVAELDNGDAVFFAETVLNVVGNGMGHHQRTSQFKERWSFNRLNVGPEMAVALSEIAKPASTGPGFEHHGHGSAVRSFAVRAEMLEEDSEGDVDRRTDADLLSDG